MSSEGQHPVPLYRAGRSGPGSACWLAAVSAMMTAVACHQDPPARAGGEHARAPAAPVAEGAITATLGAVAGSVARPGDPGERAAATASAAAPGAAPGAEAALASAAAHEPGVAPGEGEGADLAGRGGRDQGSDEVEVAGGDRALLAAGERRPPAGSSGERTGCARSAPAWVGVRRCALGGDLYATGRVRGIRDLSLARSAAAARARAALLPRATTATGASGATGVIDQGEVPAVFVCAGAVTALARAPAPSGAPVAPPCDPARVGPRLAASSPGRPGACPDWTDRVAWRDGDRLFAVGAARGSSRSLVEATAENRARAELGRMARTRVGAGASASDGPRAGRDGAYREVDRKQADCDAYHYVLIVGEGNARDR